MLRIGVLITVVLSLQASYSQSTFNQFFIPSDSLHTTRKTAVYISEAAVGGITLLSLNKLWYADYERSRFHSFNDNKEWLQMDKMGHAFSSYQLGRIGANLLHWSGAEKKEQLVFGATLGFTFLTAVEVLDGFSKEWGFSWGDMLANGAGAGLYIGQAVLWEEQRITLKYSFHRTRYAKINPEKLGHGLWEEFLKDYNGQTYWVSFNLHSFLNDHRIPKWLNVALGYSGDGMVIVENEAINTSIVQQDRQRQFFFSLDVDLSRMDPKSALLRSIFDVLNVIKVPFPTVEFTNKSGLKLHGIYF